MYLKRVVPVCVQVNSNGPRSLLYSTGLGREKRHRRHHTVPACSLLVSFSPSPLLPGTANRCSIHTPLWNAPELDQVACLSPRSADFRLIANLRHPQLPGRAATTADGTAAGVHCGVSFRLRRCRGCRFIGGLLLSTSCGFRLLVGLPSKKLTHEQR